MRRLSAALIAAVSTIARGKFAWPRGGKSKVFEVANLEVHAWHGCNLACESCSHYSSLGMRGGPTAQICEDWMGSWAQRLSPRTFSIVGGEPTLNRDLARIVQSAASIWPRSEIRVVTNGFLLAKHTELPAVMSKLRGRAFLEISSHHGSEEFQAKFRPVRELAEGWEKDGVDIRIKSADQIWTRRYAVNGDQVDFLNGDPRSAWQSCVGKHSKQIYLGKLWKCPPITYFDLLPSSVRVEPFWRNLAGSYKALPADCSDDELATFLGREEEDVCRLCPSKLERFELPNPLKAKRNEPASTRLPNAV
jgi:hypothetical protein